MEAPRGRKQTLFATTVAAGIVQLPTAAIVVALPVIHGEFQTSIAELQWTVIAFHLPFSSLLIAAGRLADVFGRRRLLIAGSALFAAGSVVAAVSPNVQVLVAGLAICGIGGAALIPSSMSLLTNVFTGSRRGLAIGMWGAAMELVSGVGVLIGGVLTGELSWRWIFGVDITVILAVAVVALWAPESRDPDASRRIDVPGAALASPALIALILALVQGASWGWGSPAVVSLLIASAALFAAFAWTERRSPNPMLDLSFFKRRNFTGAMTTVFAVNFSFSAVFFFLPLYLEEILGYSPSQAGLLLLPLTVVMVVVSPLGGRVASRIGPRTPIVIGLGAMAAAVLWISTLTIDTTYSDIWVPTVMLGFGIGFAITPLNLAAMNAVSRDHAGAAAGLLVTVSSLSTSLGVAVTGAVFQAIQIDRTLSLVRDAGVRIGREGAHQLIGVLGGSEMAEGTLQRIAGDHAKAAEAALREAFVSALGTGLKLVGALLLLGIALAAILLRRSTPADAARSGHPIGSALPQPAPRGGGA